MLKWLLARPLITHTLLSAGYTLVIASVLGLFNVAYAPIIGALIVSTFFYGREAGQREHDLKHMTPPTSAVVAWLGAEFAFKWDGSNFAQWGVAAGSSAAVATIITVAEGWALPAHFV
jgi:hypothetical protein